MNCILLTILIITLILSICILIFCYNRIQLQENWEAYKQSPLNYIQSGSSPLAFYRRNRYRKPYRYPLKHYDSSPYPNMSYWH